MRAIRLTLCGVLLAASAQAQVIVDSGSTGADGKFAATLLGPDRRLPPGTMINCSGADPLFPDACTVNVPLREPPNHIFNFTTVDIDPYVTVKFTRNAANTPVFILATGNVNINGLIDVNGERGRGGVGAAQGGPGGFNGGTVGESTALPKVGGAGGGPGGGRGGFTDGIVTRGPGVACFDGCYGNAELQPLIGGSGGGGAQDRIVLLNGNGGGGGGALLIASSGSIDLGGGNDVAISAKGGANEPGDNSGSGGAVRLVANLIRGSRAIVAHAPSALGGTYVGLGRIRLESPAGLQYTGTTIPAAAIHPQGRPIFVFPPITPILRIVSIGGVSLPAQPFADAVTPDISLQINSVNVVVEATHVPEGTLTKFIAKPQFGAGDRIESSPVPMTGPARPCATIPGEQCSTVTVALTLPPSGIGIISALIDSVTPVP